MTAMIAQALKTKGVDERNSAASLSVNEKNRIQPYYLMTLIFSEAVVASFNFFIKSKYSKYSVTIP